MFACGCKMYAAAGRTSGDDEPSTAGGRWQSGNPLLEMFVEVMAHPLRRGIAAGYNIDDGNRDAFMRHNNIIQALSEHDPHKAHAAAMDHISHSLDNIRERERMRMQ